MIFRLAVMTASILTLGMASSALALDHGMGIAGVNRAGTMLGGSGRASGDDFSSLGFSKMHPGGVGFGTGGMIGTGKSTYDDNVRTGGGARISGGIGRNTGAMSSTIRPPQIVRGIGGSTLPQGGLGL